MTLTRILFFCHWLLLSSLTFGFEVPNLTGPVIDEVALLSPHVKRQISQVLFRLQKESGVQIQVYITKSLQEEPIENVAIQIFDQWKLGDEKTDKGLLFIIAPNEKKLRIEVGQGLEGDIPDVIAKRIISDVVKPYFVKGDFNQGILQGIQTLQSYIENPDATKEAIANESEKKINPLRGGVIAFIIIGIWLLLFFINPTFALFLLYSILRGGRGSGTWSGGGGGGSWSGGGGRSSGGGASGGW